MHTRTHTHLQSTTQLVHHQGGQGLLLDILGHDQQRVVAFDGRLQNADDLTGGADLLVDEQDAAVLILRHL